MIRDWQTALLMIFVVALTGCATPAAPLGKEGAAKGAMQPIENHLTLAPNGDFCSRCAHEDGFQSLRAATIRITVSHATGPVVAMVQHFEDCFSAGDPDKAPYIPGTKKSGTDFTYTVDLGPLTDFCVTFYNQYGDKDVEVDTRIASA